MCWCSNEKSRRSLLCKYLHFIHTMDAIMFLLLLRLVSRCWIIDLTEFKTDIAHKWITRAAGKTFYIQGSFFECANTCNCLGILGNLFRKYFLLTIKALAFDTGKTFCYFVFIFILFSEYFYSFFYTYWLCAWTLRCKSIAIVKVFFETDKEKKKKRENSGFC